MCSTDISELLGGSCPHSNAQKETSKQYKILLYVYEASTTSGEAEISIEDHAGPLEDKPMSREGNIALVR
jgi:hypothetical protein